MSIQSEIDRLVNAKSSIKTALSNKGISVSEVTTLDGYGEVIENSEVVDAQARQSIEDINTELGNINTELGNKLSTQDISDWAKASEKPTYTASEVGAAAETHDHNLQDLSGTLPIPKGGTGATNASDALANLGAFRFLGNNVIASTNDDTTSNWVALGSGYAFFSNNGLVNDQPSQWGIVVNFVTGSDIFQMWRVQTSGPTYWRGGNASGWYGTWVKVYDTANKPTPSDIGAASASHAHNLQDLPGTVPLSKGGTGATTFAGAQKALFGAQGGVSEGGDILTLPSGFYTLPDNTTTAMNAPINSWSPMLMVIGNRNSDTAEDGYPTGASVQMYFEWDGTTWIRRRQWSTWSTPIQLLSDADTKPTLSSTDVEIVQRTQYTYIGNTLVMSGITPEVECANNAVTSYNVWFPKTFSIACVVMASLYYNNDDPSLSSKVSAVAGWYRNDTVVIKFANTSGATRKLRASWLAIGM